MRPLGTSASVTRPFAKVGKLVKPLGSDPREFAGSTPALRILRRWANWQSRSAQTRETCGFDSRPSHPAGMGKLVKPPGREPGDAAGSTPAPRIRVNAALCTHSGARRFEICSTLRPWFASLDSSVSGAVSSHVVPRRSRHLQRPSQSRYPSQSQSQSQRRDCHRTRRGAPPRRPTRSATSVCCSEVNPGLAAAQVWW